MCVGYTSNAAADAVGCFWRELLLLLSLLLMRLTAISGTPTFVVKCCYDLSFTCLLAYMLLTFFEQQQMITLSPVFPKGEVIKQELVVGSLNTHLLHNCNMFLITPLLNSLW